MNNKYICCKGCKERNVGCHATCEKKKRADEMHRLEKDARQKETEVDVYNLVRKKGRKGA